MIFKNNEMKLLYNSWSAVPVWLAILIYHGWKIEEINMNTITIQYDEKVFFLLDLYRKEGWHSLWEIFIQKSYGNHFENKIVIDVGMNIGDSSIYFAYKRAKKVIGLEPIPIAYGIAVKNIQYSNYGDVIIPINKGLSWKSEKLLLYYDPSNVNITTTDFKYNSLERTNASQISIETTTLEDVILTYGLDRVDIVKIDCEGCEYDFFSHIDLETMKKVNEFIVEFHDYPDRLIPIFHNYGYNIKIDQYQKVGILRANKK